MKLLGALFAVMLGIGALGLWVWRSAPEPAPCVPRIIQMAERDGVLAEAFELRCPSSLTTHVTLRAVRAPEPARSDVFVAEGAVPVSLSWRERELSIRSPAQPLVQESNWRGTRITLQR